MPRTLLYNAVPLAVLLLALILLVLSYALPTHPRGLSVELAPINCECFAPDRVIVLHVSRSELVLNVEALDPNTLAKRLSEIYAARVYRDLLVSIDGDVSVQRAADVIDLVQNAEETRNLNIRVLLLTPGAMNPPCRMECYNLMKKSLALPATTKF